MKILFIDSCHPVLKNELVKLNFVCHEDFSSTKEEIEQKIFSYNGIIIRSRFKIDKNFLDRCTELKFIARVGAGMENIDLMYAEEKKIKCFHAPEGNRDAVGEFAVGMLLNLFRKINKADGEVREGKWIRERNRGEEIQGKTIGIIGYGNTGSALAKKLSGFDCNIIAYDKYKKNFSNNFVKEVQMEEILSEADVLSLHLPLNSETEYLVNDSFIQKFRNFFYLINTSRGKIVNTEDLVKNLKSEKILGACLDVLAYESLSFEQLDAKNLPEPFHYLAKSSKVILSPHIAGWTFQSNEKMAKILAEKIKSHFA